MAKTMIFVTHDMDEAVKIADKICIMRGGHILQYDTPEVILKKSGRRIRRQLCGYKQDMGFARVYKGQRLHDKETCDLQSQSEQEQMYKTDA